MTKKRAWVGITLPADLKSTALGDNWPGDRQADCVGVVTINGKRYKIKAKVHTLSGYSAHADQQRLLNWVAAMPKMPGMIKLVHGEPTAQKALAGKLRERGYQVS